jgi:protein TonB
MLQKKTSKGDIEKRRNTFFALGLVMVLALIYGGFELFATQDKQEGIAFAEEDVITMMEEDVPLAEQPPPPEAPAPEQQAEAVLEVVEDNVHVDKDWDFSQDFNEDLKVEDNSTVEVVDDVVVEEPPVRFAEKMPEFKNGGFPGLTKYLGEHTQYPEFARQNGLGGISYIEFVVEKDGSVSNPIVLDRSGCDDCDKEAIRVVKSTSGMWSPGQAMGKNVRVYFRVPVTFVLN